VESNLPRSCTIRLSLKCDDTRAETRFRLSSKRTSPFRSTGASVQSTTDSRGVRIGDSNAGYTMFRGSVKGTGYPLHSPVSRSLPLPCVTVRHHISTGLLTCFHTVWVFCPKVAGSAAPLPWGCSFVRLLPSSDEYFPLIFKIRNGVWTAVKLRMVCWALSS
jgi:hypothetical protein